MSSNKAVIARSPADILRTLREAAGFSQREVAVRAGTAQSVVARIESGKTDPSWATLKRLACATGGDVHLISEAPVVLDPQLLDDVPRILALTPAERLREVAAASRFIARARRV